ncbi:MAG: 50S ribosomal protein L9 [Clostridia bacterium]
MKVILLADVKGSGKKGQIVEVADGYAKNFLIAKKFAKLADNTSLNAFNTKKDAELFHDSVHKQDCINMAKKLENTEIILKTKCGEKGKLFGAITTKEIAETLLLKNIDIDKRKIVLNEPIKAVGNYQLTAKLLPDVSAKFTLVVEKQN